MQCYFQHVFRLKESTNIYSSIIAQHFKLLSRSLDPTTELLSHLELLWPMGPVSQIKSERTRDSKSAQLIKFFLSLTTEDVKNVLGILREYRQEHVANVFEKVCDKVPMSEKHLILLDNKCSMLIKYLDPKCGIIDVLISYQIFSTNDEELIEHYDDNYDDMSRELIQILRRKSDCAFNMFITALDITQQSHVIFILIGEGDNRPVCERDISNLNKKLRVITSNLETVNSGLLDSLVELGAFTDSDYARVKAEKLVRAQSAMLLKLIKRKSQVSFDKFRIALVDSDQLHIAIELFGAEVNGDVAMKTVEALPMGAEVDLENDLRIELQNDTELQQRLNRQGIIVHIDHGSIKLRFYCQSGDSLEYLQQIVTTHELDKLLTNRYCPGFADRGLLSLSVRISLKEFEHCRREFQVQMLMSENHSRALLMSADSIADKIHVTDGLLEIIGLCKYRVKVVTQEMTNVDKAKRLLEMISRMPDRTFDCFIKALVETDQHDTAQIIVNASLGVFPETIFKQREDAKDVDMQIMRTSSSATHFIQMGFSGQLPPQPMDTSLWAKSKECRSDDISKSQFMQQQQAFMTFETFITQRKSTCLCTVYGF